MEPMSITIIILFFFFTKITITCHYEDYVIMKTEPSYTFQHFQHQQILEDFNLPN